MSEKKNDGGPAFPHTVVYAGVDEILRDGMTLRDYFAIHAHDLNQFSFSAGAKFMGRPCPNNEDILEAAKFYAELDSRLRYIFADAMLAERDK